MKMVVCFRVTALLQAFLAMIRLRSEFTRGVNLLREGIIPIH